MLSYILMMQILVSNLSIGGPDTLKHVNGGTVAVYRGILTLKSVGGRFNELLAILDVLAEDGGFARGWLFTPLLFDDDSLFAFKLFDLALYEPLLVTVPAPVVVVSLIVPFVTIPSIELSVAVAFGLKLAPENLHATTASSLAEGRTEVGCFDCHKLGGHVRIDHVNEGKTVSSNP